MEIENTNRNSTENSISDIEADIKKARLVSSIIEKGEQSDEEEHKGRS